MDRRSFVYGSLGAIAVASFGRRVAWSADAEARIELAPTEPVARIAPELYGHFTENLGAVVYDGVWVGPHSPIANQGGIRKALIDRLRQIKAPIVRWPGGCFADSYDWKDGTGASRPVRTGFWGDAPDTNAFGTPEFMRFCKLVGAEPYLAANLRSLSPMALDRWIEYCNAPAGSTTLALQRAKDGSPAPYNARYWGVGNEPWGCGGGFEAEEYAAEFVRYTTWAPHYDQKLSFVGGGPSDNDLDWTRRFFEAIKRRQNFPADFHGWSIHHYTWNLSRGGTKDWDAGKGDALNFDKVDWYESFREASVEKMITDQWDAMGAYDPDRKVKLVMDEYGAWYRPGTALDPSHALGQQSTLRDALVTALTLDTFNRHAEKMGVATCAQLINCLNALFFSHGDKFIVTPVFHVFDLYAAHQGATAIKTAFDAPDVAYDRDGKPASFTGLSGSASINGKRATITCVNPSTDRALPAQIAMSGANIASVEASTLTDTDIHAHNTFEQPDRVRVMPLVATVRDGAAHLTLPPASVTKVTLHMA